MLKKLEGIFAGPSAPHAALALLTACVITFGLLSPWLGFYQDDWHFIYYANQGLSKVWELSAYDNRPFASWPYIAGFALLGFRPFAWQVIGIVLRWLTAFAFWLFFRALWPRHSRLVIIPALLFVLYPLYTLQPMAVTYITHWVCYLLYALSLWLMVLAARDPRRLWPLLALSVVLDGIQLFTIEYFNGVELLRPVILWMALAGRDESRRSRLAATALTWLPYLLVLAGFIFWRGFIFQSPAQDNNAPTVLRDLFAAPVPTVAYLASAVLKDSLLILPGAWAATVSPALVDISPAGLGILLVSVLAFGGAYLYLRRIEPDERSGAPAREMLLLGALGVLLGPVPAWVTRQPLYDTNPLWNSRLGMASMFGAALAITALVEGVIRTRAQRALVYSLLLALAAGFLLRSENSYRHAWEAQVSFLNQLAWRAPGIQPGTAVISEGEVLPLMGDYPTAFAINMIYQQERPSQARVWYFPTYGDGPIAERLATGGPLRAVKFSTRFEGEAGDSIAFWYDPSISACLHVLTPLDAGSRLYSDYLQAAARRSAVGRILSEPALNTKIFSQALRVPETWCTYFEKAELAEQSGDWQAVLRLWGQAKERGLEPSHGAEYLPFLRAALSKQDYAQALIFTEAAARLTNSQAMRQTLCLAWQGAPRAAAALKTDLNPPLECPFQ
ncbi:MAG: hypothetical protein ACM3QS_18640 [Bacteroidota bacterium]